DTCARLGGRVQAPQGLVLAAGARVPCRRCGPVGAGFIAADGGGHNTAARALTPLAGIKRAPQGLVLAAGSCVPRRSYEPVGPGSSRPTGVGTTPWRGP